MILSKIKKIILSASGIVCVLLIFTTNSFADNHGSLSAKQFLHKVRMRESGMNSWAMLSGKAVNKRRNQPMLSTPISLSLRFTPTRTLARVLLDNKEGYIVGRPYADTPTTVIPFGTDKKAGKDDSLGYYGLRAEDLTMAFLYWKLDKELPGGATVQGLNCRVFDLDSPHKDELAKVFISTEYLFPVKMESIKTGQTKPYRVLEIGSLQKVNEFWFPSNFELYGPGWRTKVNFTSFKAGYTKDGVPKNLFTKPSTKDNISDNSIKKISISK